MQADLGIRRLVGSAFGALEQRAASFEMPGGLGPDFFPMPAPAAASSPLAGSLPTRGHELLEQRAASYEMRGGLGPDFYPS